MASSVILRRNDEGFRVWLVTEILRLAGSAQNDRHLLVPPQDDSSK
jgi:hypothetical protein